METNIEALLSARIVKHCLKLYQDGHFKHAAREAMIQVEQALKEKGRVKDNLYGQNLIVTLFSKGGKNKNIKLRVPLGNDLQENAEALFKGAFSYYRNYAAHDGSKIDQRISLRILIIASELLDLIDASDLSFEDIGGIEAMIEAGEFDSKERLVELLKILDDFCFPDPDGATFRDEALNHGFFDLQFDAVFDLNLVRYEETEYSPSLEEIEIIPESQYYSVIGCCSLTDLGREVIEKAANGK